LKVRLDACDPPILIDWPSATAMSFCRVFLSVIFVPSGFGKLTHFARFADSFGCEGAATAVAVVGGCRGGGVPGAGSAFYSAYGPERQLC
jgi:uncharacterized membrane protein YphA (DoxX/SURF4 family)